MGLSQRRGDAEGANFESAYALRGYGVTSCGFWIRLRASRLRRDMLRIFANQGYLWKQGHLLSE